MHPNLNELGIIIRLIIATIFAVISLMTSFFSLYVIAVLLIVFALSGYCPIQQFIDKKRGTQV